MIAARKAKKLTQGELGVKVGLPSATAQAMISQIETGAVNASKFVLPICKALRIPPPMHFISAEQRAWSKLGHRLEEVDEKQFAQVMSMIATIVETHDKAKAEAEQRAAEAEQRRAALFPKKKTRAVGSATLGSRAVSVAPGATLPFEKPPRKK